jgi:hypothetical protein
MSPLIWIQPATSAGFFLSRVAVLCCPFFCGLPAQAQFTQPESPKRKRPAFDRQPSGQFIAQAK